MKIVIISSVAAGTSVAAMPRRTRGQGNNGTKNYGRIDRRKRETLLYQRFSFLFYFFITNRSKQWNGKLR